MRWLLDDNGWAQAGAFTSAGVSDVSGTNRNPVVGECDGTPVAASSHAALAATPFD